MRIDSLFQPIETNAPLVEFEFEGHKLQAADGSNLAAALLAAGIVAFRYTPVSGAPRAAFCMMGACFDCLVDIDGVHRQACMSRVHHGLVVRQIKPELEDE